MLYRPRSRSSTRGSSLLNTLLHRQCASNSVYPLGTAGQGFSLRTQLLLCLRRVIFVNLTEWASLIQAGAALLGVVGLGFVYWQIRLTKEVAIHEMTFGILTSERRLSLRGSYLDLLEAALALTPEDSPVTDETMACVLTNREMSGALAQYLGDCENICAFVNMRYVDEEAVRVVLQSQLVRVFLKWEPFIEYLREKQDQRSLYCELQSAVERWEPSYWELRGRKGRPWKRRAVDMAKIAALIETAGGASRETFLADPVNRQ